MIRVFINGSNGTTGLRLQQRLETREDITLLDIPFELRHDPQTKKEIMNSADLVFFCLPDDASKEDIQLIENPEVKVIDTSTAHRTLKEWTYGFAELAGQKEKIQTAYRLANPGCHASGFIALVAPLVQTGLLKKDAFLSCTSVTGYSGGGKKMIAQYEDKDCPTELKSPRLYGLTQQHKHLKEMVLLTGLETTPAFLPVVSDYYAGMETIIPIAPKDLTGTLKDVQELYANLYNGKVIQYKESIDSQGFIPAGSMEGKDSMEVSVTGNEERIVLVARFDNLGKGASGAAIQNMNLMMHMDETRGLSL